MPNPTARYTLKQLHQAWGAGRRSARDANYFETAAAVADYLALRGLTKDSQQLITVLDAFCKAVIDDDHDWFVHAVMFGTLLERAGRHMDEGIALEQLLLSRIKSAIILLEKDAS